VKETNEAAHWQERAAFARSLAEKLKDPTAKEVMLRAAREYDQLAGSVAVDRRSRKRPPPRNRVR